MEDESLVSLFVDLTGEIAEEFSESVPFIKMAGDGIKIALSIPDRILWRKIDLFLKAVPTEKWRRFSHKVKDDPRKKKKVGDHLLVSLDKMDEMEKPEVLAKMFCAFLDEKINLETLRRLASCINAAYSADLYHVSQKEPFILASYLGNLLRAGLSETESYPELNGDPKYRLNHLGRIFQQIMRDEPITG